MSLEVMKQALEALEKFAKGESSGIPVTTLTNDLRQAIEQAEKQEPVTWLAPRYEGGHENIAVVDKNEFGAFPVYTTSLAAQDAIASRLDAIPASSKTQDLVAKLCENHEATQPEPVQKGN